MKKEYFDFHCDTAYEMYHQKQGLLNNRLQVSVEGVKDFSTYVQVMAFWTNNKLSDEEGWERFLRMQENLLCDPAIQSHQAVITTDCPERYKHSLLLSIEDCRIFANDLSRIEKAYALGVRFFTPLWSGVSSIGGAHNTDCGLTETGKRVVKKAVSLGMIPDISHASLSSATEILEIAEEQGVPCIASHSNAYEIRPVSRNLHPHQIKRIMESGGIIGLNLHSDFLAEQGQANTEALIRHIDYFAEHGAAKSLCFGCDFDGGTPPSDISGVASMPKLFDTLLQKGFSEEFVKDLFFENAYRFTQKYMHQ